MEIDPRHSTRVVAALAEPAPRRYPGWVRLLIWAVGAGFSLAAWWGLFGLAGALVGLR